MKPGKALIGWTEINGQSADGDRHITKHPVYIPGGVVTVGVWLVVGIFVLLGLLTISVAYLTLEKSM